MDEKSYISEYSKITQANTCIDIDFSIINVLKKESMNIEQIQVLALEKIVLNNPIKINTIKSRVDELVDGGFLIKENNKYKYTGKKKFPTSIFEWNGIFMHEFKHYLNDLKEIPQEFKNHIDKLVKKNDAHETTLVKNEELIDTLHAIILKDISHGDGKWADIILKSGYIDVTRRDCLYFKHAAQYGKTDTVKYLMRYSDINSGRGSALLNAILNTDKKMFDLLWDKTDLSVNDCIHLRSVARRFVVLRKNNDRKKEDIYYYMLLKLSQKTNINDAINWLENKKPKHSSKENHINKLAVNILKTIDTQNKMKDELLKTKKDKATRRIKKI